MILPKKPQIQIQIQIQNTVKNFQKGFIEALWHAKAFNMATFLIKLVQGGGFTLKNSIYGSNFSGADLIADKNIKKEVVLLQRMSQKTSVQGRNVHYH